MTDQDINRTSTGSNSSRPDLKARAQASAIVREWLKRKVVNAASSENSVQDLLSMLSQIKPKDANERTINGIVNDWVMKNGGTEMTVRDLQELTAELKTFVPKLAKRRSAGLFSLLNPDLI